MNLSALFDGLSSGTYIEVANNAINLLPDTQTLYSIGWRGVNITPIRETFNNYRSARPEDITLCFQPVRSNMLGEACIEILGINGNVIGYFEESNSASPYLRPEGSVVLEKRLVKSMSLKHCISLCAIRNNIDLLIVDTSLNAVECLAGMDLSSPYVMSKPTVIALIPYITNNGDKVVEHNQNLALMSEHGYKNMFSGETLELYCVPDKYDHFTNCISRMSGLIGKSDTKQQLLITVNEQNALISELQDQLQDLGLRNLELQAGNLELQAAIACAQLSKSRFSTIRSIILNRYPRLHLTMSKTKKIVIQIMPRRLKTRVKYLMNILG